MIYRNKNNFRLHEYEIRPEEGLVVGPDGQHGMQQAAMDVLVHLAKHAGEVVDADTLLKIADRGNLQDPAILSDCVRKLRSRLGDNDESPRFIQKVAQRGYRLVAPVSPSDDIVFETASGPIHVHPMDGDHDGEFLLETSSGPVVVRPISSDEVNSTSTSRGWFAELRRRRVFRSVGAYAVVAWLALQIVDVLSGILPVPDWTLPLSTAVLAAGFPIVALLSWAYQWTPRGLTLDIDESHSLPIDRFRLTRYFDLLVIGILLVVVVFLYFGDSFRQGPTDAQVTVAVLPFTNLGSEPADDYLSLGIADDIRARLYGLPQFLIAARGSSRTLSEQGLDISEIGDRLRVKHVLEGSVRHDGERVRVNVQLIDTESGFSRWIENYDTRLDNVLDMQNTISLAVASKLEILLTRDVRQVLAHDPTENPDAYIFYLQARAYLDRPRSLENLQHAKSLFDRAIELDPAFALGYAGLCRTKIGQYSLSRDAAYFTDGEADCLQALKLDSTLAAVHIALGGLYRSEGRWDDAERAFLNAIEIDSRAAEAFSGLGDVYSAQKRNDEAEEQYRQAISRQPGNWTGYTRLGRHHLLLGNFADAIVNFERVIELSPDNASAHNNLGVTYFFLGDFQEAANQYRQSLAINPGRSAYSNTGTMLYYAGEYEEAAEMFRTASKLAPTDYRLWGNLADAVRFSENGTVEANNAYRKAIQFALERLTVNPADGDTLSNLAWYYANVGDIETAIDYLTQAEEVASEFAEQLYVIGITYKILGETGLATDAINKALNLGFSQIILDATPELNETEQR